MSDADHQRLKGLLVRKAFAFRLGLEMPDTYRYATDAELLRVCNGVGNESMAKWKRRTLTFLFRVLEVNADIHDFRFEYADGTKKSWKAANLEMKRNNATVIRYHYPLVFGKYFRNIVWRAKAWLVDIGLRNSRSFDAWMEAHEAFITRGSDYGGI